MNALDHEIERRLKSAATRLRAEPSVTDTVMSRIEGLGMEVPLVIRPRWDWSRRAATLAAAAAAVLVISGLAAWFAVAGSASLAYADVTKAMAQVKTARLDVFQPNPKGGPAETATYFYERGVGLRMEGTLNGTPFLFIDNGKRQWTRTGENGLLQESAGTGLRDLFAEVLLARDLLDGAKRDASGDQTLDGLRCRLFSKPAKGDVTASRVWLDERNLVRKMETGELRGGKWAVRQTVIAHHDVTIDRALFQPPAAAAAPQRRAITTAPVAQGDLDARIAATFSLERALAKREILGLVLALHEVRRGDDGTLLVLTSLRPTAETLKKYGTGWPGWNSLGDHDLQSADPKQYLDVPVGTFDAQRLYARWDLLVPRRPPLEPPATLTVVASGVYTRDELYEANERAKTKWYENDVKLPPVPVPEEKVSFSELVDGCWSEARAIHSLFTPAEFWNSVTTHPDGSRTMDSWRLETGTSDRLKLELQKAIEWRRNPPPWSAKKAKSSPTSRP